MKRFETGLKRSVYDFFRRAAEEREGEYNPQSGKLTSLAGHTQTQILKAVESRIGPLKFGLTLDVGSGPGRYMQVYGEKKSFHVLVDAVRPMLELAKQQSRALGFYASTDFVIADIEKLPIRTNSCDFVSCIDTLHHIEAEDKNSVFSELARVATHDGYLFVEIKNRLFPHYMFGLSKRNPSGVSIGSNYLEVRSFLRAEGLSEVFSVGAHPWGLTFKVISPSILMGFRKDHG